MEKTKGRPLHIKLNLDEYNLIKESMGKKYDRYQRSGMVTGLLAILLLGFNVVRARYELLDLPQYLEITQIAVLITLLGGALFFENESVKWYEWTIKLSDAFPEFLYANQYRQQWGRRAFAPDMIAWIKTQTGLRYADERGRTDSIEDIS